MMHAPTPVVYDLPVTQDNPLLKNYGETVTYDPVVLDNLIETTIKQIMAKMRADLRRGLGLW